MDFAMWMRNAPLFYFGILNLLFAVVFLILGLFDHRVYLGARVWNKPIKFALSIGVYVLTLARFSAYFDERLPLSVFNWAVILSLGFEILYIAIQAARQKGSHFYVPSKLYSFLYFLMAFGATVATLAGAWLGVQFFVFDLPELSQSYLWSIRLGISIFVVFAFQGFLMGSRMAHAVGAADGSKGIPFLNWSFRFGDLRVAHFLGMHAIQIIPMATYFFLNRVEEVVLFSALYTAVTALSLFQAMRGRPLIKVKASSV